MGLLEEKSVFAGTPLHDPRMDKPKKTYPGLVFIAKLVSFVVLSVLALQFIKHV